MHLHSQCRTLKTISLLQVLSDEKKVARAPAVLYLCGPPAAAAAGSGENSLRVALMGVRHAQRKKKKKLLYL